MENEKCVPAGPEPIPAGVCKDEETFKGSSGYRKIPGNTCVGGIEKDKPVEKDCKNAAPPEGKVIHQNVCIPNNDGSRIEIDFWQ
jgi:hypothetical protein